MRYYELGRGHLWLTGDVPSNCLPGRNQSVGVETLCVMNVRQCVVDGRVQWCAVCCLNIVIYVLVLILSGSGLSLLPPP